MSVLFYFCDKCSVLNFIPAEFEDHLQFVHAIICGNEDCLHEHTDLKDIKNFSKATKEIRE